MLSRIKTSLLSVSLLLVCTMALAQGQYTWKEGSSAGYKYKYVTNDPMQSRFYTLKNGLTVILSPTPKEPRIQFYIATKAGSKTDPSTNTGLAHYLEHMLFKGTNHYGSLDWKKEKPLLDQIDALYEVYNHTTDPAKRKVIYHQIDSVSGEASKYAIANEYDKLMSEMGAQGTNAFTSYEQTVYTEDIPSNAVDKFLKVQADRFNQPVLRIFHTELEAVYEEKNRGLDNDPRKVNETMMASLFQNHNYGKQTTLGTVEHLKNPSLVEIRKYFNTYYVPNNMGIIASGDFNPDVMIKKIDAAFGYMKSKPVPKYTFQPEQPITAPVVKDVYGPDAEFIAIGYRLPGIHDKDALLADLVGQVLTNGRAGLMDLNLVKKQKLLRASAYTNTLVDYGMLMLQGAPTQGQTLDEVRTLMLGEIDNLKKGNFDDALLTSIINNSKKYLMQQNEKYSSRADALMYTFTGEDDWQHNVAYIDLLSKLTRKDIVDYANKYLGNNYVAVYKRKGEDKNIVKVEKPAITPVETNAGKQSPFVKEVAGMPVDAVKPVWLDYQKDIQRGKVGPAEILYVQNKDNGLFRMAYRINTGTWNDKRLGMAANYLQFLGTGNKSAEEISKEFYKLACSFNISAGQEFTTISLEGLQENFAQATTLLEDLLKNCKPDEEALAALKARTMKSRSDAKNNKGAIMQGLVNYARYGASNPFNNVLSNAEVQALTAQELVDMIHQLPNYPHRVLYYGPQPLAQVSTTLASVHKLTASFTAPPPAKNFAFSEQSANQVLFTDYDMVQSEIRWVRNIPGYDPMMQPEIELFNNYFGGNMGSVVFQTIRESKALAYSTSAYFVTPERKEDPYYISAYVGSQADKLNEATAAMNELLKDLPAAESNIMNAKSALRKNIETERITQDAIIYNYLAAERRGLQEDYRKAVYEKTTTLGYNELKSFHSKYLSGKPYTYVIVASEKRVSDKDLAKLGQVKKLSKEEIFGY
jgi:predicted Zn-dependent peptidase